MFTFKTRAIVVGRTRPGQLTAENYEPDAPRSGIASKGVEFTRVRLKADNQTFEVWAEKPDMPEASWNVLLAANRGDVLEVGGKITSWNVGSHLTLRPTKVKRLVPGEDD